ncbi:hypothetical protein VNO78_21024 [Psophocarpus tetragonolobus]|uniref:Uncharacterized protein n=1 Tax=Psophocarpus tetragonolobus TaxID=3891 RepID=A0AAN9SBH6_PSOTE
MQNRVVRMWSESKRERVLFLRTQSSDRVRLKRCRNVRSEVAHTLQRCSQRLVVVIVIYGEGRENAACPFLYYFSFPNFAFSTRFKLCSLTLASSSPDPQEIN